MKLKPQTRFLQSEMKMAIYPWSLVAQTKDNL
jgi:hypothetical protein